MAAASILHQCKTIKTDNRKLTRTKKIVVNDIGVFVGYRIFNIVHLFILKICGVP